MSRKFTSLSKFLKAHHIAHDAVPFRPALAWDLDFLVRRTARTMITVENPFLLVEPVADLLEEVDQLVGVCKHGGRVLSGAPATEIHPADWLDDETFPADSLDAALVPWLDGLRTNGWDVDAATVQPLRSRTILLINAKPLDHSVRMV